MRAQALLFLLFLTMPFGAQAAQEQAAEDGALREKVDQLDEPLYTPFVERYILDELKQLRREMAEHKVEVMEKVIDRELTVADKSMTYATDTVTYFFYLIAAISTLFVLVGWTSMRDLKAKLSSYAESEVARITEIYEERLQRVEHELMRKSETIKETQDEIALTNEIHSLWLKASQETSPQNKMAIYDQILALRPGDTEALTYKADEALAMGEIEWAKSLCNRVLEEDADNGHAYYQRACAYAESGYDEAALEDLRRAIDISPAFAVVAAQDESFRTLAEDERFKALVAEPESKEE